MGDTIKQEALDANIKIYYHNDMDGMFSRVVMEKWVEEQYQKFNRQIEAYELSYGSNDAELIDKITGDEALVIFVDYSFSDNTLDTFKEIFEKTNYGLRFIWIDHHDSSIKFVKKYIRGDIGTDVEPSKIKFAYDQSRYLISKSGSAAYLAWAFYQRNDLIDIEPDGTMSAPDMYKVANIVPPAIRYVSDYDTFEHRLQDTDRFKLGYDMDEKSISPSYKDKHELVYDLMDFPGGWDADESLEKYPAKQRHIILCNQLINNGGIILDYVTGENKTVIDRSGYESLLHDGTPIYVCNRMSNSWVFGDLYDKYKYVVVWYFDGTEYHYSMFSNLKIFEDADCEVYAKHYGGGGHKGAAGWCSRTLMFMDGIFIPISLELVNYRYNETIKKASNGCEAECLDAD